MLRGKYTEIVAYIMKHTMVLRGIVLYEEKRSIMNNFVKKIIKIILVHFAWQVFILCAALNNDSFNDIISSVSFFLIEPINLFIVYPTLVYIILYRIIKKAPYTVKNEKRKLLVFSLICTLISMQWIFRSHIEAYIEDGFSILSYGNHWLY